MITAPFNFVPLSEKVFFPPWAEDVSHDIPFEDGESGVIDITVTAKSPIFIRNHSSDRNNPSSDFCNHNGEYYIPSTSVKGMIRSVLEIMSFSKMSQFDDDTYAVRDLSSAKNFYMTQMREEIYCGWLKKDADKYIIEDCGLPGRIRHEEIDSALKIDFSSKFKKNGFEKTSEYKYNLIGGSPQVIKVGELYKSSANAKYDKRLFCRYDKDGREVTLVVTGQPTPRKDTGKMGDGKGFEFAFFDVKSETALDKKVYENFLFAYFDKRKTQPEESPDWTFWKKRLNQGERVPIFFQKNGKKIQHFGLSYLYKLPYTHSIKNGIPKEHFSKSTDFCETLFGYVNKSEKTSLKGRVSISHFRAIDNITKLPQRTEILGTPRASYYPMYISQEGNRYKTYMDSDFELAGRKRYPIHNSAKPLKTEKNENENVGTTFIPLGENVVFSGKVRYHNLKKEELGSLISAFTFHNTQECYHNIGMAKSLGYGKIKIQLSQIQNKIEYLKAFEMLMMQEVENWSETKELQELFSMAIPQKNQGSSALKYMELKEFAKLKNGDNYLKKYTNLDNIKTVSPLSLVSKEDLKLLEERKQELLRQKEQKEADIKLFQEYEATRNSKNIQKIESFIAKYSEYEKVEELQGLKMTLQKEAQNDKFSKVNDTVQKAWDSIHDPKYKAKIKKALEGFVKKWSKTQNNKGSEFVLEFVEKAKIELK